MKYYDVIWKVRKILQNKEVAFFDTAKCRSFYKVVSLGVIANFLCSVDHNFILQKGGHQKYKGHSSLGLL